MIPLESTLNTLLTRIFPAQLPSWFRKIIADWAWVIVMGVVVVQPPISAGYWSDIHADKLHPNAFSYLTLPITACTVILQIVAIPFLKNHKRVGWELLYLSAFMILLYGIVRIFSTQQSVGPLFGMTFLTAIFLYMLFQVRIYFKA